VKQVVVEWRIGECTVATIPFIIDKVGTWELAAINSSMKAGQFFHLNAGLRRLVKTQGSQASRKYPVETNFEWKSGNSNVNRRMQYVSLR
jgi:hypothetical protein